MHETLAKTGKQSFSSENNSPLNLQDEETNNMKDGDTCDVEVMAGIDSVGGVRGGSEQQINFRSG